MLDELEPLVVITAHGADEPEHLRSRRSIADALERADEFLPLLGSRKGNKRPDLIACVIFRADLRESFKEPLDRHVEDLRELKKAACANAVGAAPVLLDLLE
jgi:hypothetical protein